MIESDKHPPQGIGAGPMAGAPPPDEPASEPESSTPGEEYRDFSADMHRLIDEGRALLAAEVDFQQVRLRYVYRETRAAWIVAMLGSGFLIAACITLALGALLALQPHLGAWGSMFVVTGAAAATGALATWRSWRRMHKLKDMVLFTSGKIEDDAP